MTNTEKKVVMQLCTKILTETELYEIDMEVRNLVDWICVSEQMKENNNKIRSLTGGYKQIEQECWEGIVFLFPFVIWYFYIRNRYFFRRCR